MESISSRGEFRGSMSGARNVPMLLLREIAAALEPLGYAQRPDRSFARSATPDGIEHWIELAFMARPPRNLGVAFGISERISGEFGRDALRRFDPVVYGAVPHRAPAGRLVGTSLGAIAGWAARAGLLIDDVPPRVVAEEIALAAERHVVPFASSVVTLADLLALLLRNESPFEWYRGNGAIRAAAISSLGTRVGWPPQRIRDAVAPFLRYVKEGLGRHAIVSPEDFVDRIIEEASIAQSASDANGRVPRSD